jgi:hypothetical protein
MSFQTSPCNNSSPTETSPRPSRASPAPPIDLGAQGIAVIALPPTPHQEKNNLFLSTLRLMRITLEIPPPPSPTIIAALGTPPPASQGRRPRPPSIWERRALLTCWLSLPPPTKKNLFLSMLHVVRITLKIPSPPPTIAALGTPHPAPQEPGLCQQGMWKCSVLLTWLSLPYPTINNKNLFLVTLRIFY